MTIDTIKELLSTGENAAIEFKTSTEKVSHSVYESVCAFLNRSGGRILLGVQDDGTVIGVNPEKADTLIKDIINAIQNSEMFLPTPFFTLEKIRFDDKIVIALDVPVGQYVYRYNGRYWDRNGDADIDVTDSPELLLALFERKNPHLFEERFVKDMTEKHLDQDTFRYCRNIVKVINPKHPWLNMSDWEILVSCGLVDKDSHYMKYAALLLFGTDEALANFMPRYRYEGIFRMCTYGQYERMEDVSNRYDDRVTVRSNLIRVYDRLLEFIIRHLPDKFYLPAGSVQRQDLRIDLFREILGNMCVHTDYSTGYACFLEIYKDCVITRNSSRLIPQVPEGNITIQQLGNYTKNPLLVKVFRELEWVEELGSGTRNILKYAPLYYPDYQISIQSGQQFLFAITYAEVKNGTDSTQNVIDKSPNGTDRPQNGTDRPQNGTDSTSHTGNMFSALNVDNKQNKRRAGIVSLISRNPSISANDLAEELSAGLRTIKRDLKFLSDIGIIRHVGPDFGGHWEVIKKK